MASGYIVAFFTTFGFIVGSFFLFEAWQFVIAPPEDGEDAKVGPLFTRRHSLMTRQPSHKSGGGGAGAAATAKEMVRTASKGLQAFPKLGGALKTGALKKSSADMVRSLSQHLSGFGRQHHQVRGVPVMYTDVPPQLETIQSEDVDAEERVRQHVTSPAGMLRSLSQSLLGQGVQTQQVIASPFSNMAPPMDGVSSAAGWAEYDGAGDHRQHSLMPQRPPPIPEARSGTLDSETQDTVTLPPLNLRTAVLESPFTNARPSFLSHVSQAWQPEDDDDALDRRHSLMDEGRKVR